MQRGAESERREIGEAGVRKERGAASTTTGALRALLTLATPLQLALPIAAISQYSPRGAQSSPGPERHWPTAEA